MQNVPQDEHKRKWKAGTSAFTRAIQLDYPTPEALKIQDDYNARQRAEFFRSFKNDKYAYRKVKNSQTSCTIEFQGSVMRVKTHTTPKEKPKTEKPNKHAITEFSRSSRRTLQDKLMSLSDDALVNCKFVTLTYHEFIPSPDVAKQHLRAFYKRVARYCDKRPMLYKPAMFWRIEVKERLSGENIGKPAPHFHLFLFGIPYIPKMTLLKWWHEITGDNTITQLYIKRLDNRRKVMNYVSKYVSKQKNEGSSSLLDVALYLATIGRHWGFEGKENIPFAPIQTITMHWNCEQIQRFVRFTEELFPFLINRWSYGYKLFFFGAETRDTVQQVYQHLIPDFNNPLWGWVSVDILCGH